MTPVTPKNTVPDDFSDIAHIITPLAALWKPRVRLPLSQWAEKNITLSSEYASRSSKIRLFAWQRDVFDAFTDPSVSKIVLLTARQLVKTILIQCASSYVVCEDPGPILVLQPDVEAAKAFSRERLVPMIRDNACLRGRMSDSTSEGNLVLMKNFPGGSLALVGARASSGLRRRSVRYLFADEVDAYMVSVGTSENKEGDPLTIAAESLVTFGSRSKMILASTPTTGGISRIGRAFAASDQRKPYVPCPVCKTYQLLKFFKDKEAGGVWFDSSLSHVHSPATARYECVSCHYRWTDIERKNACEKAEWRASKPFAGTAGFWISQLYSPWISMSKLVSKFFEVKDDREQYRAFVNTVLAEEWVDVGEKPDQQKLYDRRESYPFGDDCVIPQRGLFLTMACDVQESPPRLEVELKAWGRGRENWSMGYWVLQAYAENGQPLPVTSPEVWAQLDALLQKNWLHESGKTLPVFLLGIDTGKLPKPVYDFARKHPQLAHGPQGTKFHTIRTVVPLKGTDDELQIVSSVSKEDAVRKRQGVRIYGVGTICAKGEIYDSLTHVTPVANGTLSGLPVPRCKHFPYYQMSYFDGLCSEVRVIKPNGDLTYVKRGAERNEPLDLDVYNRAMAAIIGVDRLPEDQWLSLEKAVEPVEKQHGTSDSLVESSRAVSPAPHAPSPGVGVGTIVSSQSASIPAPPLSSSTPSSVPASQRRPTRGRFF